MMTMFGRSADCTGAARRNEHAATRDQRMVGSGVARGRYAFVLWPGPVAVNSLERVQRLRPRGVPQGTSQDPNPDDPMSNSPSGEGRPPLDVRDARATSVFVHQIDPGRVERFLQWQRGLAAVMAGFAGYRATDIYPP